MAQFAIRPNSPCGEVEKARHGTFLSTGAENTLAYRNYLQGRGDKGTTHKFQAITTYRKSIGKGVIRNSVPTEPPSLEIPAFSPPAIHNGVSLRLGGLPQGGPWRQRFLGVAIRPASSPPVDPAWVANLTDGLLFRQVLSEPPGATAQEAEVQLRFWQWSKESCVCIG
ncbi:hypothetical protein UVI_02029010 [Ustilaginoidea virens]|uniref:Uncharacterized protein n=1 Tax=Ustilaginoidea virens TaxID=1159556 RepID=A0A1B5KUL2_USTVR|nr:hypothetical protein UVI_02029010 [Ustilaginoidea virens]